MGCPRFLAGYESVWAKDPRSAVRQWFAAADYGLFLHYGLYSQPARHEWAMCFEAIPIDDYERLADSFDPAAFDADRITDLAGEAGMRYVNLTACHHEGFCLWDSAVESFNSVRHAGRDLVRELAEQCDRKGLGFFIYYTHVLNWRHPYALTRDLLPMARPAYRHEEPRYRLTRPEEWRHYWDYAQACMEELCRIEYPIAGIWLDIIKAYYLLPDLIPIDETYAKIRAARPEALIAFKQGATGTEDFAAPEFHFRSMADTLREEGQLAAAMIAERAWAANRDKHNEICLTLQEGSWGWREGAPFLSPEQLWQSLGHARANDCNLLANVGPLPDGSLPIEAVDLLRQVGGRIRAEGMPTAVTGAAPEIGSAGAGAE